MNKIAILALGAVFAVSMIAITAFEVEAAPPSKVACPAENVQYWATFSFAPSGTLIHPTLPTLPGNFHVLEVQVPPDQAYMTIQIVLDRLIEIGYLDATSQPLVISDVQSAVPLGTSSTICAEN